MKNIIRITVLSFLIPFAAQASVVLKQIDVENPTGFNISFNSEIKRSQAQVEFLGDIIQVTIHDVAVYPPKIIPVTGGPISKIFAYQYSPKSVRCRFTVKGKADELSNRFKLSAHGKTISIKVETPKQTQIQNEKVGDEIEEDLLLEKVLKNTTSHPPLKSQEVTPQTEKTVLAGKEDTPAKLGGKVSKPLGPAIMKISIFMIVVFALAALAKKAKKNKTSWFINRIGKKSGSIIEVISTQHLGPKKAITLVQIRGRTLVLGVTDESIQLITEISYLNESDGASTDQLSEFSDLLSTEKLTPNPNHPIPQQVTQHVAQQLSQQTRVIKNDKIQIGARSQIRSRLEGLKPL